LIFKYEFQLHAVQGSGKYLETACHAEYVYQKLNKREQLREQVKERKKKKLSGINY
jgi:hypothetical protein